MRKIKGSSDYLKNQVLGNLAKAVLSLTLTVAIVVLESYIILFTGQFSVYKLSGFLVVIVTFIAFNYFLRKYHVYNGGWQGEKQVARLLQSSLSDDYYLINDLYLRGGGGDIDNIVLAPKGIFVLETKNWSGTIICQGDTWMRPGKRIYNSSPSQQVKRNAAKINSIIANPTGQVWVEGIVVLTNRNCTVHLNNPTVTVLKLPQLPQYLTQHGDLRRYSTQELEAIAKAIVAQKAQ
jgi:hypothetical protein